VACAERLAALFPALFGADGPPKPVKLRIHADVQQRAPGVFTRKALSIFMHRHTTGNAYLKALLTAPHRFDLDGQPAGDVADEHRAAAKEELERRRQIFLARRAAERGPGPGRGAPAPAAGPRDAAAPPQAGHAGEPAAMPTPGGPQPDRGRRPPRPGHRSPTQAPGDRPPPRGRESARPRADAPRGPGPRGDARGEARGEARRGEFAPPGARPQQPSRPPAQPPRDRPVDRRPADEARRAVPPPQAPPAGPEDAARRERAALLRTYEASSLSKANFCTLKRLSEAELDAQLSQARRERDARGAPAQAHRA
jgi:sRNA-binding protein